MINHTIVKSKYISPKVNGLVLGVNVMSKICILGKICNHVMRCNQSMLTLKGTHIVYFSISLYIINQKPMIPRTHFHCITT